jgi:PAS domain S-box-containing protein
VRHILARTRILKDDSGRIVKIYGANQDITERKEAEEALKKSEALLRSVVTTSPVGITLETAERVIVWVNDAIVRCSGYSAKELEGRSTRIFYASDEEFARVGEIIRNEAGLDRTMVTETAFLRKDGQARDVQLTAAPVDANDATAGIVFVVADITGRKRTDEELQKAHRRLSDIIDFLPDATFVIDREKRIVAWNKAIEEMLGVKKEEMLGKGDYAYAVPFYGEPRPIVIDLVFEGNEEMEKTYDHVQREGNKLSTETHVPRAYGGRGAHLSITASPLFDREGSVVGAIETVRDTTEQKRIEKALQESEERYRVAIENSNDGIAIVRGQNHIFVNRRFLEIFGLQSPDEVVGKSSARIVHPDDRERVREMNERRQRDEDVPGRYEFKGLRKNGETVYIEASVTGTIYQGERISLAFLRDVSERKNLEEQLRQAQKMEAVGTLAGGVAHDFNNILMALMGYANLLQMKMGLNDPSRVYVDQILASIAKAANITQSLLAFGRKQIMEMKPHKISTIVKDVEKLLQRLMPEDIELTIKLGDDATVRADMTQIDQVLINLATNARDSMPKGGRLTIETGRVVIDEEFRKTYGYGKPDAYALILITDTGTGMNEKTQEKIFEPFFTTKEPGKGTGLGLSIVYGIIKQHNGYINVSSRPGEGSTFLIYLPEVKERPRETRSVVREARGGSETLLLAEDNADIRAVMSGILKMSGYTVIDAVNGRDAVEKFREHKDEITLIILDVVMPEKNGKEAYEEMRTMKHDIKALFMSGYTADVVLDKGVFGKALDYIAKPIAPNELLHKVRNMLDR